MKKNRKRLKDCGAKLFVVCPTLGMLLEKHPNPKEIASKAQMEYSNFMKTCKQENDILLITYLKCMNGYGRDVVWLLIPMGIEEAVTSPEEHSGGWFYTIKNEELVTIVRKLYLLDKERMLLKLEDFLNILVSEGDDVRQLLLSISEIIQAKIKSNES